MAQITITLDDEALSTALQEEAARRRTTPSELVSQAARREWKEQGGQGAAELFRQSPST